MHRFDKFIQSTVSDPQDHNEFVHLAIRRHVQDLERSKTDKFPFIFDCQLAQRAISFIGLMRHTSGKLAGKPFDIQPFQAFIIGSIFGWVEKKTNYRRYSKAYTEVPRKNGKSEIAAAIANYCFVADGESGAQIFSVATKRDQAKYCFNASEVMLKKLATESPILNAAVKFVTNNMYIESTNSFYRPLSADSKTEDGANPHCAIIDEYHAHPNDGMLKVIETGQGARTQPLIFIITTAGYNKQSPCHTFRNTCINYLRGNLVNESTFAIIFTLDEDDDWNDQTKWKKANPNIGNAPLWKAILKQYNNAVTEGTSAEIEFKTKNLNIWTGTAKTFIQHKYISSIRLQTKKSTKRKPDYQKTLADGVGVVGALDLSSVRDTTSLTWYDVQGRKFETHIFIPKTKIEDRKNTDGIVWRNFEGNKNLHITNGNVIDYDYITNQIKKDAIRYKIAAIGYDPFNSSQLVTQLISLGFEMLQFRQGFLTMSPAVKALEKAIVSGTVWMIYNPIIEWMFSNVAVKMDANENIKLDKQKSTNRIDGVVSTVMAYGIGIHEDYQHVGEQITVSTVLKF